MLALRTRWSLFWRYRHVIPAFVGADLKIRYRGSVLGYLWNLINPLMNLVILAVVFEQVLRVQMPLYPLFLFAGMVPYGFFQSSVAVASTSLLSYQHFIRGVPAPKVLFPLSLIMANFVDFLLAMAAFFALSQVLRPHLGEELLWFPLVAGNLLLASIGMGLICAVVTVYFRDFSNIIRILLQAGFFGTPILYPLESIPDPTLRTIIWWNPMTHFIQNFRDIFYGAVIGEAPVPHHLGATTGWATTLGGLAMLVVGVAVFYCFEGRVVQRL